MIKKWVAEAVYLAAVLILLGMFAIGRNETVPVGIVGESITFTETDVVENVDGSKNEIKDEKDGQESNSDDQNTFFETEIGEAVKDSIPTLVPQTTISISDSNVTGGINSDAEIKNQEYESLDNTKYAWWFRRKEDHSPSGSGEAFPIEVYNAYYLDKQATDEDKAVYLTFDCGYENGFTPGILDTLAKHEVKALFFVTKDFIVKNPEYVTRMKEEGHLVGNHTVRHLSSPELTPEELKAELDEVARTMYELTGYRMDPYFRPPMGEYSERTLKVTQDLGYSSIFWSIAYYDYDVNNQPGKDYVIDHFKTYHHNGAIILMHNVSKSNAEALGEVVEMLKEEGYRFGKVGEMSMEKNKHE